jgi:hypothetical protein
MARTELTVQDVLRTGLEATYVSGDATNDHSFDNHGERVFIHIINAGGVDVTATIISAATMDGLAVDDVDVLVTQAEDRLIGPFESSIFEQVDPDNNIARAVFVDLDTDASVTLAALKLPEAVA